MFFDLFNDHGYCKCKVSVPDPARTAIYCKFCGRPRLFNVSDREATFSDWKMVGVDINNAINEFRKLNFVEGE